MKEKNIRPILCIAVAFIFMNLVGLDRSPVVWIDEVTLNDPAKELALNGRFRSSVFAGYSGFERAYFWQPPGQPLVTAFVYKVFGFGIWQTRIPVVLFGASVLIILYIVTIQLFRSPKAASFAAMVLALDPSFIQRVRSGRMDAQCLFFALSAVILYLRAESLQKERHCGKSYLFLAASGLSAGLAATTHPVAVSWAIALGLLILLSLQEGSKLKSLILFTLFTGLPFTLWILYAAASSNFELFQVQFLSHGQGHLAMGSILTRLVAELSRYQDAYKLVPVLLLAYGVALPWVIRNSQIGRKTKIKIAILFSVPLLFNALVMTKRVGFYYLHPITILAVCLGTMLEKLVPVPLHVPKPNATHRSVSVWFVSLLLLNVLAGGIAGRYLVLAYQWHARDYSQVENAILQNIPQGAIVWGPPEIWYATEKAGAKLRLLGEPNCKIHDYIVTKVGKTTKLPDSARFIQEIGQPLPPIFGMIRVPSSDYRMQIWECKAYSSPLKTRR